MTSRSQRSAQKEMAPPKKGKKPEKIGADTPHGPGGPHTPGEGGYKKETPKPK